MTTEREKILINVISLMFLAFMAWSILYMTYNIGKWAGVDKYKEDTKRYNCEVGFGDKPQIEITGECLKYFKLQEGN